MKTGKHTVTGITRADSNSTLPEGVVPVKVDYDDESTIVEALKGQQFLVITMYARADPSVHARLVAAAAKAGVPYVMPNAYGMDPLDQKVLDDLMFGRNFGECPDSPERDCTGPSCGSIASLAEA